MTERELPPPLPSQEGDTTAAPAARNNPHQHDADEQDDDDDFEEEGSGAASPVIAFAIAIAVAYIGGWKITWGAFLRTKKALVMNDHGLLVRINDLYYGLGMTDRFFDAPFISWLCLIPLFAALGFRGFVFGQGR